MARLALTVAGAVIGSFFGMPELGMFIGGVLGSVLFPGPSQNVQGPRLNDRQVMSAADGSPIAQGYGACRVGAQLIWGKRGPDGNIIVEHSKTTSQSAKGGPSQTQTTYSYDCTIALGFAKGPADILRIWADSKIIYDRTNPGAYAKYFVNTTSTPGTQAYRKALSGATLPTFYRGTPTQLPDPTIQAVEGITRTPAYRDLCYAVLENFQLADFGNRIPNFTAEIAFAAAATYPVDEVTVAPTSQTTWPVQFFAPQTCGPNASIEIDPQRNVAFIIDETSQFVTRWDYGQGAIESPQRVDITPALFAPEWESFWGQTPTGISIGPNYIVDGDGYLWTNVLTQYAFAGFSPSWLTKFDPQSFKTKASILTSYYYFQGYGQSTIDGASVYIAPDNSSYLALMMGNVLVYVDTRKATLKGWSYIQPDGWSSGDGYGGGHQTTYFGNTNPIFDNNGNIYLVRKRSSDGQWAIWKINVIEGTDPFYAGSTPWGPGEGGGGGVPSNTPHFTSQSWTFSENYAAGTGSGIAGVFNPGDESITILTDTGALHKFDITSGTIMQSSAAGQFYVNATDPIELYAVIKASQLASPDGYMRLPTDSTYRVQNVVSAENFTLAETLDLSNWIPTGSGDVGGWNEIQDTVGDFNTDSVLVLPYQVGPGLNYHAYRCWMNRLDSSGVNMADIVEDICEQAGIASTDLNTDAIRILGGGQPQTTVGPVNSTANVYNAGQWQGPIEGLYRTIGGYGTESSLNPLDYFVFKGFTFPTPVPENATIVKVYCTLGYVAQNEGETAIIGNVAAYYLGSIYGDPSFDGSVFPGPTDLIGASAYAALLVQMESTQLGVQLTPTVVNDSSFGFGIQVNLGSGRVFIGAPGDATLCADGITPIGPQLTVYYTLGTSTLVEACNGYLIPRPCTAKDAISPLASAYFFDGAESDFQLKFVPRGGLPVMNIPQEDLGLHTDKARVIETQVQEQELPKEIVVLFSDVNMNYQQNKYAKRRHVRIVKTKNQTIMEFPIVMDANTAKQIADKMLYLSWLERQTYDFNLYKPSYLVLDPTDVITFTYEGLTFEARLVKSTVGQSLVMAITGTSENSNLYLSQLTGAASDGFINTLIANIGPTFMWLLDIPLLQDSDANTTPGTGYYYAGNSPSPTSFPGCIVYSGSDNQNWQNEGAITGLIDYGYTNNALGTVARSPWIWDNVNTLTVRLTQGTALASTSQLNVLNGANALLVASSIAPFWEIVQFTTATQNVDGTWTLSGLLRGRRGTEVAIAGHSIGDTVIVLNDGNGGLFRNSKDLSTVGVAKFYRSVTVGQDISSVNSLDYTLLGYDLKPYAPCHIAGNLSSGTWTFGWVRRTRIGGSWMDKIGDVNLAEDGQGYIVEITDNVGNVKRTFQVTSNRATYTPAQQMADFGSPQTTIYLRVSQVSGQIGEGFAASAVISTSTTLPAIDTAPPLAVTNTSGWLVNGE